MFLEEELFLSKLTLMFEKSRLEKKIVRLTMKRYDGRTKPPPSETNTRKDKQKSDSTAAGAERMLLIRAHLGQTQKISTVVPAESVPKFQDAYCKLLRNNMDGLKKEKKKKKNVNKTTQA